MTRKGAAYGTGSCAILELRSIMKRLFYILAVILLTNSTALGQVVDSLAINDQTEQTQVIETNDHERGEPDEVDDFSPGLLFFALFAFGIILLGIGAGIVLTVVGLLALAGLIGAGILSASILVGLNKKSFTKGFKTFLISAATVGGLLVGMIGFGVLNLITHWWTLQAALLSGSLIGIVAGFAFGLFAFYVIQRLTTFLRAKLKTQ